MAHDPVPLLLTPELEQEAVDRSLGRSKDLAEIGSTVHGTPCHLCPQFLHLFHLFAWTVHSHCQFMLATGIPVSADRCVRQGWVSVRAGVPARGTRTLGRQAPGTTGTAQKATWNCEWSASPWAGGGSHFFGSRTTSGAAFAAFRDLSDALPGRRNSKVHEVAGELHISEVRGGTGGPRTGIHGAAGELRVGEIHGVPVGFCAAEVHGSATASVISFLVTAS